MLETLCKYLEEMHPNYLFYTKDRYKNGICVKIYGNFRVIFFDKESKETDGLDVDAVISLSDPEFLSKIAEYVQRVK